MGDVLFRVANLACGLLFALFVIVQLNDPDPLPWMAVYGAALALCVARAWGSVRRELAWGLVGVALVWAGWIAIRTRLEVPLLQALGEWDMHSGGSEEVREIGGLLLVAGWSAVVGWHPRAKAPPSAG